MDVSCLTVMNLLNPSWPGGLNLFGEREYNFCTLSCTFQGIYRPRSAVFNLPLICPKCKRSSSHKWCTLLNKWKTLVEWFSKAQHIDEALSIHTCIWLTLEQHEFELCGSTCMWSFFHSKYCSTARSAVGWILRCGTTYTKELLYGETLYMEGWL